MAYKIILVHVDESRHVGKRIAMAANIAAHDNARLIGVAIAEIPDVPFDPITFDPADPYIDPLVEVPRQRAAATLSDFEDLARQFGAASIETRLEENKTADGIGLQARYTDLVVLGQYDPDDPGISTSPSFAETVILKCGVPVLMVPYAGAVAGAVHTALVSWNASLQAVRAVRYALPLLQRASKVDVAVFDPQSQPRDYRAVPDKDILAYLAAHGIAATVTRQVTNGEVGKALLSLAGDLASDLLVMGAFGHTRLREILMGGVTREILRSMTLPVLMAH
jgi:nucleotide-binding universal stress UspA family protein